MTVASLRHVADGERTYDALAFVCPGCVAMLAGLGVNMLPVNTTATSPSWHWDGNLERPTVQPSILTRYPVPGEPDRVCHSFLRDGRFEFLGDCTHSLAGQTVDMVELPVDLFAR